LTRWWTRWIRDDVWPTWIHAGVALLVMLTLLVTGMMALLIWRDGFKKGWRSSRVSPPMCLQCGYNMSGLTQCRCPECGKDYTLDELWTAGIRLPPPGK